MTTRAQWRSNLLAMLLPMALPVLALVAAGCGDDFPDQEMHFGLEDKTRPYAVLLDPPDVSPGEEVSVTLLAYTPDAGELDVSWRVALAYDAGLYGADETEDRYVALAPAAPTTDDDGFLSQTFTWTVPDSVLFQTPALPPVLDDPLMLALIETLLGDDAGTPPTRNAVAAWLGELTPADVAAMAPAERETVWALADLFACQVRFRARLWDDRVVEVTRNLTVRHTRRLGGPLANANARVTRLGVTELHKIDADRHDLADPGVPRTWHPFIEDGARVADRLELTPDGDHTYWLQVAFAPEEYVSPFDPLRPLEETGSYRWYYLRRDAPTVARALFVDQDGEDAEMWQLDDEARLQPATPGEYRVLVAVRDERSEWQRYHLTPGLTVVEGTLAFAAP
jgi:hypothetical protein